MSDFLPFIVLGLVSGSVYGLAGTGLVLTYKTSGILNFAQGALGTVAAYLFYFLRTDSGVPWPIAFVISVLVLGVLMGSALEVLARRLALYGAAVRTVAPLGIILVVEAGAFIVYDSGYQLFPGYLPSGRHQIGDVSIGTDQLIIVAISLVGVVGLSMMLRLTRTGMAMRAVVDSPELLALEGISPVKTRRRAWIIGTTFACLAGVLLGPTITLNATLLTLLVVQAFGAAVIGRFQHLALTYVGGLVIGVVGAISAKYALKVPWLSGFPASLPFIVVYVGLLVIPRDKLSQRWTARNRPLPRAWHAPPRARIVAGLIALVFFVLAPTFVGTRQFAMTSWLIHILLFLSLGLLVKLSGQVSLCQFGLAAVGAATLGQSLRAGLPWLPSLLIAIAVTMVVGAFVAFSAIRLSGIYLAVATYGFAILLQQLLYNTTIMFQPVLGGGLTIRRPGGIFASQRGFYYLVLAIVVVVAVVVVVLESSRFGRLLRALSDSQLALETQGTTASVLKLTVFCLSALIAGLAGGLLGTLYGVVDGQEFASFNSLSLFVILMLIFSGTPWYAVMGGAALTIVPTLLDFGSDVQNYMSVLFGASAIVLAYQMDHPPGLPHRVRRWFERGAAKRAAVAVTQESSVTFPRVRAEHRGLSVGELFVRYGGVVALDGLSLQVPVGTIAGLIGPNGAGKTTAFNAISGSVRPRAGHIELDDTDLTGKGVAARARLGLGRTFQRVELWESLTVRENVTIGCEANRVGARPLAQIIDIGGDAKEIRERAAVAMSMVGIAELADEFVSSLSTGQRRLVELARCLAADFDLLLLDEPSSGLDTNETVKFGQVLRKVVDERGVGILLVEHDMSLVMDVCDHIYVLDFGRPLMEGSPSEVASSPAVRAAYLGTDELSVGVGAGDRSLEGARD